MKVIIGLIADTHDCLPLIDKAIERLNREKVDLVLHAGDYIAGFSVQRFKSLKAPLIGIFGNNDGDHDLIGKKFKELGAELRGRFAEVIVDGLKIAMLHGEEEGLLNSLVNAESYDFVVHAHTHKAKTYLKGKTVIVNPGEVCGYVSGKSTIALLNTETLEVKIIQL